jgi:hypothetical protein
MSPQTCYSKGPHPILWVGSRAAIAKITLSDIPKSKLLCDIYSVCRIDKCSRRPHNTTWRPAARGLGTHDLIFPLNYFLEFSHSGGRDRVIRVCSVDMNLGTNRLRYSNCKCAADIDFVSR